MNSDEVLIRQMANHFNGIEEDEVLYDSLDKITKYEETQEEREQREWEEFGELLDDLTNEDMDSETLAKKHGTK